MKLLAADGSLLEMNSAGLRMLEANSFQQVKKHCVYPLVVEPHRPAFRELIAKAFRGESGALEFEIVGLKGGRRWLEMAATPLRDDAGGIIALLGISRDITESKRAEQELQTQLVELRHDDGELLELTFVIVEHADHGFVAITHDNDLRGFVEQMGVGLANVKATKSLRRANGCDMETTAGPRVNAPKTSNFFIELLRVSVLNA